jgi:hypothetical protein
VFENDLDGPLQRANGDPQPVRRVLAAPNLITTTVERLNIGECREKITREDFERKFTELHNRILVSPPGHCRQIRDSHGPNLGVRQNLAYVFDIKPVLTD